MRINSGSPLSTQDVLRTLQANAPAANGTANEGSGLVDSYGLEGLFSGDYKRELEKLLQQLQSGQLDIKSLAEMIMMLAGQQNAEGSSKGQALGNLGGGQFSNGRACGPKAWGKNHVGGNFNMPENVPQGSGTVGDFLKAAVNQRGDRYVFGAECRLNDANPHAFDCSELVQWAAAQAGVKIPDGANNQAAWVRKNGTGMSVEEALRTPGALLFKDGHVAISLGDGRTIEAKGSKYGVGIFNARGRRWTSAGRVPGMRY